MKRAALLVVGASLTAGCWAVQQGAFRSADFPRLGIRTIAVLPIVNQTQVQMAPDTILAAMARVLRDEKKYDVMPQDEVARRLSRGAAAGAYIEMVNRLSTREPVPDAVFDRMATGLEADGLMTATVTSFHQVPEQGPATNAQGLIYYTTFDVTVIEVKGELYSPRARAVVWRDSHLERQYMDPRQGTRPVGTVATAALRGLLRSFPENTWAPVAPSTPAR